MANKAAQIVSSLIAGTRYKTFIAGGKAFTIKSPCIRVLCRALKEFSQIDLTTEASLIEGMLATPEALSHVLRALAYVIVGNVDDYELEAMKTAEQLECGTTNEIAEGLSVLFELMSLKEVFLLAVSGAKSAEAAARTK